MHRRLRKYRFFYYERDESLVSDYEYDMLEKKYAEECDRFGIHKRYRVDNFVGFNIRIPMNIYYEKVDDILE